MNDSIIRSASQVGPPAGVSGLYLAGVSLPDWVLIVTLFYGVAQLYVLIRDKFWRHHWRQYRAEKRRGRA